MSIQSELWSHLTSDTNITDLVGTRIYPLKAPQNVSSPYMTYQVVNGRNDQCMSGDVYQKDTRFQIDVWSKKYSEADAIKEAVKSSIIGFKSSYDINNNEDYEPKTELYRQIIDFKLKG